MKRHSRRLSRSIQISTLILLLPCLVLAQNRTSERDGEPDEQRIEMEPQFDEAPESDAPSGVGFSVLGIEIRLNGVAEFNAEYLDVADL